MLTRIVGKPTTDAVDLIEKECAIMCVSVKTALAGGRYGHLVLVKKPVLYSIQPRAIVLARPTNPGPYDTAIWAAMQPIEIELQNLIHNALIGVYEKYDGWKQQSKKTIKLP